LIGDTKPKSQEEKRLDAMGGGSGGNVPDEYGNFVNGDNSSFTPGNNFKDNLIVGSNNTFIDFVNECLICAATRSTIRSTRGSVIAGTLNEAKSNNNSVLCGSQNYMHDNEGSITAGNQNENKANWCIMSGKKGIASGNNRLVVGNGDAWGEVNTFYVNADGNVYATGYNSRGADYAEYFEWADGNPDNEDRCGMLVQLASEKWNDKYLYHEADGKISLANGDDILGIISACPSVVGNAYGEHWHGRYKRDIFGAYILDENGDKQISEDYDKDREYIPRSQRQEWAAVGLLGQLVIRDNGKCQPGGYVEARQGIGVPTFTETNIRCIKRIDDKHCLVLIK